MIYKDNYLSEKDYQILYEGITSDYFPLYFNLFKDYSDDADSLGNFQFTHSFYGSFTKTSAFNLVAPLVEKINPKSLIRIKLNLNPYSQELIVGNYHQDQTFKCKGAIYYLNTNNGYTLFKEGEKKVTSVKNRIVFFDADEYHLGTNSTDCKNRLVLNFNYF
tara:strand:- start:110 stop:595 length:486 start_codon:yes stop_codon:yes gene_type:complete